MKSSLLFVVSIVVTSALGYGRVPAKKLSCNCGWRNSGRIIGGKETGRNEYPWMAAIQDRSSRRQFCGGVIVSPWHILTAAHCSQRFSADDIAVTVGAYDVQNFSEETAQFYRLSKIVNHPAFNDTLLYNDIAVLVTATEIKFNQFVGPACFPNKMINDDLAGQYLKVTGWGRYIWSRPNNDWIKKLKEVDLQVIKLSECVKHWPELQRGHVQICTYSPGVDSCKGDSGGPLVWLDPETNRYTLVGLVSDGADMCGSPVPAFNTNVSYFISWIKNVINATRRDSQVCSKQ